MQLVNREIVVSGRGAEVKIVALGCIHHGAAGCREDLADFWYKRVLAQKDTFCILGGDLVDSIFERDKRYMAEEVAAWCRKRANANKELIDAQYEYALEKWKPLAAAGKILWLHTGNHELTLKRYHSRNLPAAWSQALGVPYAGYAALSNLIVRYRRPNKSLSTGYRVSFYTTHGAGSAQSDGAVMNAISRMLDRYDVDVALMWHLHRRMAIAKRRMGLSRPGRNSRSRVVARFQPRDSVAAICGTFLDGHIQGVLGYGETKGYPPVTPGPIVVHFKMHWPHYGENRKIPDVAPYLRIWISEAVMENRGDDADAME